MLVGGGEGLGLAKNAVLLSEVLHNHVKNIRACIREFIISFVDAIKAEQAEKKIKKFVLKFKPKALDGLPLAAEFGHCN